MPPLTKPPPEGHGYVYKVESLATRMAYVGMTTQPLNLRFSALKSRKSHHHRRLGDLLDCDDVTVRPIRIVPIEDLPAAEAAAIEDSPRGWSHVNIRKNPVTQQRVLAQKRRRTREKYQNDPEWRARNLDYQRSYRLAHPTQQRRQNALRRHRRSGDNWRDCAECGNGPPDHCSVG